MEGYSEWMVIPSGWLFRVEDYSARKTVPSGCLERCSAAGGLYHYELQEFERMAIPTELGKNCLGSHRRTR